MENIYTGTFEVEYGEITVCDPCYDPHSYNLGEYLPALNGSWAAYVEYDHEPDSDYMKPSALFAIHVDFESQGVDDTTLDYGYAGVDSGQMCIWSSSDYTNADPRYDDIAYGYGSHSGDGTLSESRFGKHYLGDHGIASLTFYGDGEYQVRCWYLEEADKIYAVRVDFK